ncbi:MAG: diguanylate cyclase [Bacillota bacterium]
MERFSKIAGILIILVLVLYIVFFIVIGQSGGGQVVPLILATLLAVLLLLANIFLPGSAVYKKCWVRWNIYFYLLCISFIIFILGPTSDLFYIYFFVILEMAVSCGHGKSWRFTAVSALFYISAVVLKTLTGNPLTLHALSVIGMRVLLLLVNGYQCSTLEGEEEQHYEKEQDLLEELRKTNNELTVAHEELQEKVQLLEINNKKLESSYTEFYTLQQISMVISSILDLNDLLRQINDMVIGIMGVKLCVILLWDDNEKVLVIRNGNLSDDSQWRKYTFKLGEDLPGKVMNLGEPIILNNVDSSSKLGKELGLKSMLGVPLKVASENLGVILVGHQMPGAFDNDNLRLLSIITGQVSVAIENANLYQRMQELATIDGLTKICNRLYFQDRYLEEFALAQQEKKNLALIMFDVDHFKKFNDTFGHLLGDKVLQKVAATVKKHLREKDLFARYGGEEFVILLPDTTAKKAFKIAERMRELVKAIEIVDHKITTGVTVSIGVAAFPTHADTERELLMAVDDALYQAKTQGRNRVCMLPGSTSR